MATINRCVVRNQAYRRGGFSIRQRHNERENESYGNGDIVQERSTLNVRFKECRGRTYAQAFNRMVEDGTVSLRGLKPDAKVFAELVFDVNSAYFEDRGGYAYAKRFFAEAYKLAVKEAGGEAYVLSAILHADERNKALSEQHGRDVFHYHLHVVYVPVVDKEVYYKKNHKDPNLAGTLKEVIRQVSHSKKWPLRVLVERNGRTVQVNSYSLLQDRFHTHMQEAGYTDIARGEHGSTAEHLSVLEYKTQQERERAAALAEQTQTQQLRLNGLQEKTRIAKQTAATFAEIGGMAKKTVFGKMELSPVDWGTVSGLAKEGIVARAEVKDLKRRLADARKELHALKDAWNRLCEETRVFREAVKSSPGRVRAFLQDIISRNHEPQERKGQEHDR
jgi:hypothetical protein